MSRFSSDPNYVRVFDTTLRDGEQSPGATMTSSQKLEVAEGLARLGVDIIEAGFPAASLGDHDAVRKIAETVGQSPAGRFAEPPVICGLARTVESDLKKCWSAVGVAKYPRIHTFLATSPIHREHKLRMSKKEVLQRIREMVGFARTLCEDIEFSPEDAGRTEPEFLWEALSEAVDAGATTLNIPDTVGYTTPTEFGQVIADIRSALGNRKDIVISVHCHNDLGMATANTLAGIQHGARQVEVAVNGIGERAGNTALEEVVMAIATRPKVYAVSTGVDTKQIMRVSRLVSRASGISVQPNKAIVGANAFAHESGIHQDGMLKNEQTYEILRPESIGMEKTQLVLGKHSGRHAFRKRLEELGFTLGEEAFEKVFASLKKVAERKKVIADADLIALVSGTVHSVPERFALEELMISHGTSTDPRAEVRLRGPEGELETATATGSGPVDACFKAIDQIVKAPSELLQYTVQAVTEGVDALGEVTVRVRAKGASLAKSKAAPRTPSAPPPRIASVFAGHGADTDILIASAKAYLDALNRLIDSIESSPALSLEELARRTASADEEPSAPSAQRTTA